MAIVKIIVLVGLTLCCLIISLGGSPSGELIGFRYWKDPGAFTPYLAKGDLGRFLGFWSCIVQAAFMFMGCEVVGIAHGEAKNPRRAFPRAVQQTIRRIAVFYIGGVIVLGMTVPYTSDLLLSANDRDTSSCKFNLSFLSQQRLTGLLARSIAASPFVVALNLAGVNKLPAIVDACFLMFTVSFANSGMAPFLHLDTCVSTLTTARYLHCVPHTIWPGTRQESPSNICENKQMGCADLLRCSRIVVLLPCFPQRIHRFRQGLQLLCFALHRPWSDQLG